MQFFLFFLDFLLQVLAQQSDYGTFRWLLLGPVNLPRNIILHILINRPLFQKALIQLLGNVLFDSQIDFVEYFVVVDFLGYWEVWQSDDDWCCLRISLNYFLFNHLLILLFFNFV